MKRKLGFSLFFIAIIGLFGFFRYRTTDAERFNQLMHKSDYGSARLFLSEVSSSDSSFLLTATYRLELNDSSGDLHKALQTLIKIASSNVDSAGIFSLYQSEADRLKKKLNEASPASLTSDLQALAESELPNVLKLDLAESLKERAKKEQTVASWNNCILFLGTGSSPDNESINQRRRIFLDTLALKRNGIPIDSVISKNPCYTPILKRIDRVHNRAFSYNDLFNPDFKRDNYLSSRYIVGDFNSVDANGNCRGSYDVYANDDDIPEFRDLLAEVRKAAIDPYSFEAVEGWYQGLNTEQKSKYADAKWMWRNYLDKVHQYKTEPLNREPVIEINGKQYCIGQRLCLCEIRNDTIVMVAQFVTSSRNVNYSHEALRDYDKQPRYYAPRCLITSRYWDRAVPYDSLDKKRDKMMGFASQHAIKYMGRVDLPNFLHMTPTDEFPGAKGYVNGIHEFAVGGNGPAKYMGTPISLGCVRLHDYPSKFVRWWIPKNARFFISYEYKRYKQRL